MVNVIKVGNWYIDWNQVARHRFVLNLSLTCVILGLVTILSLAMAAGVFESPALLALGCVIGVLMFMLSAFLLLWGKWVVDHVHFRKDDNNDTETYF